jgi:hypothetical protein
MHPNSNTAGTAWGETRRSMLTYKGRCTSFVRGLGRVAAHAPGEFYVVALSIGPRRVRTGVSTA